MLTIKTTAVIGAGVIGAGWAARFALNGLNVRIFDLSPHASKSVARTLDSAHRAYEKVFGDELPPLGCIDLVNSVEEACHDVQFIQESLPERESLKCDVLATIGAAAGDNVVIASSTSGLLPSRLQAQMPNGRNLVVGHPFNPVYLMPLVEVCAGDATSPSSVDNAIAFYTSIGMRPLKVRKEIDGFIADRLMEAMWREALWLVNDNVATAEEIDDAIRFGPGLRWAMMGSFLTYRVAGGEAGMRHFMDQFGPTLKWPWTKLMDVPDLNDELLDKIVQQSDEQAGQRTIDELERKRDDCLVAIMQGLQDQQFSAGETLANYRTLMAKRRVHK